MFLKDAHSSRERVLSEGNSKESETEDALMEYFNYGDEEPIDLSNRNGQRLVLDKQSDEATPSEQRGEEKYSEQSNDKIDSSENGRCFVYFVCDSNVRNLCFSIIKHRTNVQRMGVTKS